MAHNEENATEEPQQTVSSLRQMFEARSARAIGRRPSSETVVLPASSASLTERRSFFETNRTDRNADVVVSPRPPATVDESLSPDALLSVGSRIMALQASVERSETQANLRRRPKAFDVSDEDLPSVKARSRFFETAKKTAKVSKRQADMKRVADLEFEQSLQRFIELVQRMILSIETHDPDSECIPETE